MTEALLALDYATDEPREIAIVWPRGAGRRRGEPLLAVAARGRSCPTTRWRRRRRATCGRAGTLVPFVADKIALGGRATAYVCVRGRCELPATDPAVFRKQLEKARPY